MSALATTPQTPMRRWRWAAAAIAIGSALVSMTQPLTTAQHDAPRPTTLAAHASEQRRHEVRERFEQGVVMLHARRYDDAVVALQRVLTLAPRLPEAHVNLGYAWLGLKQAQQAQHAFDTAIGLRADQANAYYGLAMALEQRGELDAALGAMRSYLHLSHADDLHRVRARAAIWEWEQSLGRHRLKGAPSPAQAGPHR